MNCNSYQHDLSCCLDGRLPASRRAEVLAHVDECPKCTGMWEEMQAAQSLVFTLEPPRVAPDFRDQVWDRIHTGEGAPEILLQAPVTAWTKVRYGTIGAAAAAAFLFGMHLLTMDKAEPIENANEIAAVTESDQAVRGAESPRVMDLQPAPTPTPTKDASVFDNSAAAQMFSNDFTAAGHLATETVDRVAKAASRLKIRTPVILSGKSTDQQLWKQVHKDVQTIDGGLHVLDSLLKKDLVLLEPSSQACLTAARMSLKLYDNDTRRQTVNLVRTLDNCPLEGLTNVRVTYSIQKLRQPQGQLFGLLADDPVLQKILTQLGIVPQGGVWFFPGPQFAPGAQQQQMFMNFQQTPAHEPTTPPKKELRKRRAR